MAYFSNGSEGMCFEDQCAKCKYGQEPCPIAAVQISDYLGYYIGQEVSHPSDRSPFKLVGINEFGLPIITGDFSGGTHNVEQTGRVCLDEIKLRLRPPSDMTREEAIEVMNLQFRSWAKPIYEGHSSLCIDVKFPSDKFNKFTYTQIEYDRLSPATFHYLLKQGFDLFNLIPAGLAVDKTKEVTNVN